MSTKLLQRWKFKKGTKVFIVRESGSYSQVTAENGMTAYIAADSLKPIENKK